MRTIELAGWLTVLSMGLVACAPAAPRLASATRARAAAPGGERGDHEGLGSAFSARPRSGLQCEDGTTLAARPHPDGQLRCCVDRAGLRHGTWQVYSRDGQRLMQRRYQHDKKHGPARGWHENGQLHAEGHYEDGLRQGLWRFWNDAGLPLTELVYRAGVKVEERVPASR